MVKIHLTMHETLEMWVWSLGSGRSPGGENGSILAWKIPWTEEPGGCSPCSHSRTWLSTHILSLAYAYNLKKVKIPSIFLYELLVKAMTSFPQVNSSRILRNTLKLCIILGVIRKNNKASDLCSFSLSSVFAPALVWWLHCF